MLKIKTKLLIQLPLLLIATMMLTACPPDPDPDFISASTNKVTLENGKGQVNISSNVSWNVTNIPSWLTCSSMSGKGNMVLQLSEAEKNPSTQDDRSDVLTVTSTINSELSANITIVQPRSPVQNYLDIDKTSIDFQKEANSNTFGISSNVSWTISTDQNWCTASPTSGSNNKTITVNVTANTGSTERTATITVSGDGITRNIKIKQVGEAYLTVDKTSIDFSKDAGNNSFNIRSNVSWTVSSSQSWCTISSTSGSNEKTITVNVTANTELSSRSATITVNGGGISRTINIQQEGIHIEPLPTSLTFDKNAGSKTFKITSNTSWTVSSNQSWCTVSPTSGSNDKTITVNVTANTGSTERTATITVLAGSISHVITVSQEGEPNLEVDKTNINFTLEAGSNSFKISSNVSWKVSSNQNWCTVSPTSGSNDKTITVNVTANTGTSSRSATITVSGGGITRNITIAQTAQDPYLTVNKANIGFTKNAGSDHFSISSNVSWTVTSNQSWCTVSPTSGSNDKTITVNVTANTGTANRTATITVSGGGITRYISIAQAPSDPDPYLTVNKSNISFGKDAGNNTFTISSNVSWTVSSNQTWCTVNPTSGSNDKTITVKVTANTGNSSRSATITVSGGGITRYITIEQIAQEPYLTVNKADIGFTKNAGSNHFSISSNVSWTVSSNQTWCTVSPTSGSNDKTITVKVTANTETANRTATITVSGGGITRYVSIAQAPATP